MREEEEAEVGEVKVGFGPEEGEVGEEGTLEEGREWSIVTWRVESDDEAGGMKAVMRREAKERVREDMMICTS